MERKYLVCAKKFLGICTEKKQEIEFYDFTKKDDRMKFIHGGFVLQVRERPI